MAGLVCLDIRYLRRGVVATGKSYLECKETKHGLRHRSPVCRRHRGPISRLAGRRASERRQPAGGPGVPRCGTLRRWLGDRRRVPQRGTPGPPRSEEHTSELQSRQYLVCRLLLEKKEKPVSRARVRPRGSVT